MGFKLEPSGLLKCYFTTVLCDLYTSMSGNKLYTEIIKLLMQMLSLS